MSATNLIKIRFLNRGLLGDKEYTYYTPEVVAVNDIVDVCFDDYGFLVQGIVTQVNVSESDVAPFMSQAKYILGRPWRE